MTTVDHSRIASLAEASMRSLYPLVTCTLLLATPWLGPWLLLATTIVWWHIVTRIA